jgi:hypothetical protein
MRRRWAIGRYRTLSGSDGVLPLKLVVEKIQSEPDLIRISLAS